MKKILIVDDEEDIRAVIRLQLEFKGYDVFEAVDGQDATDIIADANNLFDLIVLDIMMPRVTGLEACIKIREMTKAPILFLTAKSGEIDIVEAYSNGGDDFLSKPFSKVELLAKVEALIRRYRIYNYGYNEKDTTIATFEGTDFDLKNKTVRRNNLKIDLTSVEADILFLLITNPGRVFDAKQLFEEIWNEPYFASANNTIMVHIFNIRKKLDTNQSDSIIKTVWGKGYRIDGKFEI